MLIELFSLLFVVKQIQQIIVAVVNGQRPDLRLITDGPEALVKLAVDWIKRCWHQNPDRRPVFAGKFCVIRRK